MPLQNSGAISISQIQTEFGGLAPTSISEYYRSGGLVPDISQNVSVPLSGTISLSNFYGTASVDLIPNAVNWADISLNPIGALWEPTSGFSEYVTNSNQSISGISQSIVLGVNISNPSFTLTFGTINSDFVLYLDRNLNGSRTLIGNLLTGPSFSPISGEIGTISVSQGNALHFGMNMTASNFTPQEGFLRFSYGATVSIVNKSSGNTVLDTFDLQITAEAGLFD